VVFGAVFFGGGIVIWVVVLLVVGFLTPFAMGLFLFSSADSSSTIFASKRKKKILILPRYHEIKLIFYCH